MQVFSKKEVTMSFDLIIGPNSLVTGNLESEASIRIDGKVKGDIVSKGNVILSEAGQIEGNITCDNLEVHGVCIGNVKSKGRIELSKSSKLIGDIICMTLNTAQGAIFEGKCKVVPETQFDIETHTESTKSTGYSGYAVGTPSPVETSEAAGDDYYESQEDTYEEASNF